MAKVGKHAFVRSQNPIYLNDFSGPEPDIAIVKAPPQQYFDRHPRSEEVILLIEVADNSLEKDHKVKLPSYALAKIPEVWIFNLQDNLIEIYQDPKENLYQSRFLKSFKDELEVAALNIRISLAEFV